VNDFAPTIAAPKTGAERVAEYRVRAAAGLTLFRVGVDADALKFHLIAAGILTEADADNSENCRRGLETLIAKILCNVVTPTKRNHPT
jgi:hypothetical protein